MKIISSMISQNLQSFNQVVNPLSSNISALKIFKIALVIFGMLASFVAAAWVLSGWIAEKSSQPKKSETLSGSFKI